jgi:hypothetical protein
MDRFLIRPGRLALRRPFPNIVVREPPLGALVYGPRGASLPRMELVPHAQAPRLVRAARQNVLGTLAGLLGATPDDRFVQAAIYRGRVARGVERNGTRRWQLLLDESASLTEQVLALFAADLLERRGDYERHLAVCEACGTVSFLPERQSPRGCAEHPLGLVTRPTAPGGRQLVDGSVIAPAGRPGERLQERWSESALGHPGQEGELG